VDRWGLAQLGVHGVAEQVSALTTLVDAAVRTRARLVHLDEQRRALLEIVDVAPRLARVGPLDWNRAVLEEVIPLLGTGDRFVATRGRAAQALDPSLSGVVIRAGTGRFAGTAGVADLDPDARRAVERGFGSEDQPTREGGFVLIPMQTRDGDRACLVAEVGSVSRELNNLCRIFGQQVGQALENLTLWERATTDALTGLHNRAFGAQRLEELRAFDIRTSRPTSVLVVDIDRFKVVNDTFGHAAGDAVLQAVARALVGAARRTDVVARWGGEELLVVLPDTPAEKALLAAERIRSEVSALAVSHDGHTVRVTASIGAATAHAGNRMSTEAVVAAADRALYAAKAGGRNRVCEADTSG